MNGSAFSARRRQRFACSFKKELSIFDPNTNDDLTLLVWLFLGSGYRLSIPRSLKKFNRQSLAAHARRLKR